MNKYILLLIPAITLFSCTAHHMTTADKAYDRMAYAKATCGYEKAMRKSGDRDAALRAADAYKRQNQMEKAADWFAYADRIAPLDAKRSMEYGQVLMGLGKHELAAVQFERVLAEEQHNTIASELLLASREQVSFYEDTTLFSVREVPLAGLAGTFSAAIHGNGIIFAGEKQPGTNAANPWNGLSYLDLYSAQRTPTGTWTAPVALPGDVNGRFHEGPAAFSADGRTMYFTRSDYYKFRLNKDGGSVSHLKLFRAELGTDGRWGNIHQFAFNGEEFSTGHAALSADGNTLYFISDRPGGLGGTDLYSCDRGAEGWNEPVNLSNSINTAGNEMFPTLHGDTLYFSSNGHRGLGGLDIYKTWKVNGEWVKPQNMNYPVNTPFDDLSLIFEKDGQSGYLSSDRTGTDRIHSFTVNEPTLMVMGSCTNELTGGPMAGVEVRMIDMRTGDVVTTITGDDGKFKFDLRPGQDVQVQGSKDEMFTETMEFNTQGQRTSKVYEAHFKMRPIQVDMPFVVNNIYYDYDMWDIRPDAAVELRKLALHFIGNPELHFELSSHTDSRGGDVYNMVLSEARAKSAVDHLIRNGVDPDRITARGYGESKLVNKCRNGVECTEEQHQQNRRTEFKVVKPEVAVDR